MKDTAWKSRKTAGAEHFMYVENTCRDMARFGLMVLRRRVERRGSRRVGFLKAALFAFAEPEQGVRLALVVTVRRAT